MLGLTRWALRPSVLIAVSILFVGAAALIVLPGRGNLGLPQPQPLRRGEQEIAWLYPATSTAAWERLATALQQASHRLQETYPGLEPEVNAGGPLSAAVPEVVLRWPHDASNRAGQRLVFRWYKITSQWTAEAWVQALLAREPPPLAVVGGNTSYWAQQLALQLNRQASRLPQAHRPLLLLTTATADRVTGDGDDGLPVAAPFDEEGATLLNLYPARTFRFCFSNRQMATAVTRFLWSRPELRPDADPAYLVQWTDDAYSRDLFAGYMRVLGYRATDNLLQQWGWVSGAVGLGLPPPALAGWITSGFRHEAAVQLEVDSSVGGFTSPNPYEAKVVRDLLAEMAPRQPPALPPRRPLLVMTGHAQPARRLLRDLARSAPDTVRRLIVATGDAVSFNTIYRDRQITWPIQDLPFTLVLFSHRNPIDAEAGFVVPGPGVVGPSSRSTGTDDLLLFRDVVEAVALAFGERGVASPDDLAAGLRELRQHGGRLQFGGESAPLFGPTGQRAGSSGEHVVCLRPQFQGDRVLPQARLEVWARGVRGWNLSGQPLLVSYDEFEVNDVYRSGAY